LKKHLHILLTMLFISILLAGCTGETTATETSTGENDSNIYTPSRAGTYDSEGTAIVTRINDKDCTITFYDYEIGKSYTLNYNVITRFSDRYDTAMVIGQVKKGSIVDVCFLKSTKTLVSLRESADTFTIEGVTGFEVNVSGKTFKYNNDTYRITSDTVLVSENGKLGLNDLYAMDKLTITGIGKDILSIILEESHGYLSLKGYDYFVGGFIEIGSKQIEKITDKMLVTVPEGKYDVKISNKGTEAVKQVVISSGEETVLDLSDIEIEEVKTGSVLFAVNPSQATIYVDGRAYDHTKLLTFEYGIHQLAVTCSGYESITRYFNVAGESATLTVKLDAVEDSTTSTEVDKTDGHFVYITAPSDVEVYIDNVYIGMSPVVFAKEAGTHTVTLRKTGYETRSFNIVLENTAEDVKYAFDSLAETVTSTTTGTETTTSTTTSTSVEDSGSSDSESSTSTESSASSDNQ